jgi:integrase/recombinase XerD
MTALAPVFTGEVIPAAEQSSEDRAIDAWIAAQKSEHTRRSYRTAMNLWRVHLRQRGVLLQSPRRQDMDEWRNALVAEGKKDKTVDSRMIAIRSFYDYLVSEIDGYDVNPVRGAKLLNTGVHTPTSALDEDEVHRLTVAAREAGPDRRLLVLLMSTTGCRVKEAIGLKVSDLRKSSGIPVVVLTRKGGRRDEVPVDPTVHELLTSHVQGRDADSHVFTRVDRLTGEAVPLSYSSAAFAVRWIAKRAGLVDETTGKVRVTPHVLRATLITVMLDKDKPIDHVQDLVGHSKTDTTRAYDRGKGKLRKLARVSSAMAGLVDLDDEAEGGPVGESEVP